MILDLEDWLPAAIVYKDMVVGVNSGLERSSLKKVDPINYIDSSDPPFYILSGKDDPIAPNRLARQISNQLKKKNVESNFDTLQNTGHNLESIEQYLGLIDFIDLKLGGKAKINLQKNLNNNQ